MNVHHSHNIETLEPASSRHKNLPQIFLERMIIPKVGEQLNRRTHTTRDLKGKYVIAESSKNA